MGGAVVSGVLLQTLGRDARWQDSDGFRCRLRRARDEAGLGRHVATANVVDLPFLIIAIIS